MKLFGREIELTTRRKVVIFSFFFTAIYFVLATPISTFITNLVTVPNQLENIIITRTNSFSGEEVVDSISIVWNIPEELDVSSISLSLEPDSDDSDKIEKSTAGYESGFEIEEVGVDVSYSGTLTVRDYTGLESSQDIKITTLFDEAGETLFSQTNIVNRDGEGQSTQFQILVRLAISSIILLVGSLWITQFAVGDVKQLVIGLYPVAVSLPYLYLTFGYLFRETSFTQYLLASITSIILLVITYLVLLTMNILYASTYTDLPLAQAAKAAQFVFSLIASYLIFVMFFGSIGAVLIKLALISVFLFYYTFSSLVLQKNESDLTLILVKSLSLSLTMIFAIFVLATWPVNYIFAMLASAIIYYIMLNVSLEVKYKISKNIWGEYILLAFLVVALLFLNSSWGINGSLF